MTAQRLSLWLEPEADAATELDEVISRLAAVHGTATFAPHLTVLATVEHEVQMAVTVLGHLADAFTALEVKFTETRCEQVWHHSLYLAAVAEPALRRVFDTAVRAFGVPGKPGFEPHLSLQYSQLPVADKLRLAARLELELPRTVRFDRLSLWQTPGSDASRWRPVAGGRLATGRRSSS